MLKNTQCIQGKLQDHEVTPHQKLSSSVPYWKRKIRALASANKIYLKFK